MENEILKNKNIKYSEHELYKALEKYSEECPNYIKDFLKSMSVPLLASFNTGALLKTTDILLEFVAENKDLSVENINEIFYITRHKTLPLLNNKLLDNTSLKDETKELLSNEYQSLFENIDRLKEIERFKKPEESIFHQKCLQMEEILISLGNVFEPVNNIDRLD